VADRCPSVQDVPREAVRDVPVRRLPASGANSVPDTCSVAAEDMLTIAIGDVGTYTLMCTPHDVEALAVGFAFSEGIISGMADVHTLYPCPDDPGLIRMRLADPAQAHASPRNLIVVSSCGMCGTRQEVAQLLSGVSSVGESLRVSSDLLQAAAEEMRARQCIYSHTSGTHAAGILLGDGRLVALAEDIGRHNALDKAVGQCLLEGRPTEGCAAVLSGRVSLELVAKCARAGIESIASVSAPSSLAVEVAERLNITLFGFVRDGRATVYTHGRRITDLAE
jgi:FdhD protein